MSHLILYLLRYPVKCHRLVNLPYDLAEVSGCMLKVPLWNRLYTVMIPSLEVLEKKKQLLSIATKARSVAV